MKRYVLTRSETTVHMLVVEARSEEHAVEVAEGMEEGPMRAQGILNGQAAHAETRWVVQHT